MSIFYLKRKAIQTLTRLGLTSSLFFKRYRKVYSKSKIRNLVEKGFVPLPSRAKWEMTMLCNLNCIMCHQKDRRKDVSKELKTDQIKKIIDNLSNAGVKKLLLKGG
jgi:sulfatase maturation enzyme AslB (radical SAM superfamily)